MIFIIFFSRFHIKISMVYMEFLKIHMFRDIYKVAYQYLGPKA